MSDSGGSPFVGFTEAEVHHIPPTQAVNFADVVVFSVGSIGLEPPMRTPSGFFLRAVLRDRLPKPALRSTQDTQDHIRVQKDWQIRSIRSCVLNCGGAGAAAAARQAFVASSSGGSRDSQSFPQSDRSQSFGRHRHHVGASSL